jgi:hypothetical protein
MSEKQNEQPKIERDKQREQAKKEREKVRERERLERDRQLQRERLELLKIKAGTASAEETAEFKASAETPKNYSIPKRIESFFYLYKTYIIIGGAFVFILGFLIYNTLTLVKPDIKIGVITADPKFYALEEDIAAALTPYCPDFNGDGKVSVSVLYFAGPVPEGETPDTAQAADVIKLSNEFQGDELVMIIIDNEMIEKMDISKDVLADGKMLFKNDPNAEYFGYKISGTNLAEAIGYPEMGGDFVAAFRTPKEGFGDIEVFRQNYENAVILWTRFINGDKVN